MKLEHSVTVAAVITAVTVGMAGQAQAAAAASDWSRTNGAAQASGTVTTRSGPGGFGRFYDVAGTITVSQDDGKCYYVRVFRGGSDVDPGVGTNSARQCGVGALPFLVSVFQPYIISGIAYGLCAAAPGAPEEKPYAGLGKNCV